jgi:hypothetical protein
VAAPYFLAVDTHVLRGSYTVDRQYLDVRLVRLNRSTGKSSMPEVDGVGEIGIFGQHRLSSIPIAMEVQR